MKRLWRAVFGTAFAVSSLFGVSLAQAQAQFPEKPITIILPFGPGGGTDMLTRTFDIFSTDVFGESFIVTYKPGAGGAVGTTALSSENNDGYTIGMGSLPHMFLQPAAGAGRYSLDDFDYIAMIASEPQLVVTPKGSPYTTYQELKDATQADPGSLTMGVPSPLSETWLTYKMIDDIENLGFTVVIYQGGAEMNAALLGKQVDAATTNIGPVYGEIDKLNVLGVTSPDRISFLPDVPTFRELGINITTSVDRVFMAPKGVPEDRLAVLREGFKDIWHNPEFQGRAKEMRMGLRWMDGEDVRSHLEDRKKAVLTIYEKSETGN